MYQTVDLATLKVPAISLSDGFVLFLKPNNFLFHLYGEILWLHDVGSEQQLKAAVCNFFWLKIIWNQYLSKYITTQC